MNSPAVLFFRIAMITSLFCNYVCAMTDWGTYQRQKNIMRRPESVSRILRHIFIINSILKAFDISECFLFRQKVTVSVELHKIFVEKGLLLLALEAAHRGLRWWAPLLR